MSDMANIDDSIPMVLLCNGSPERNAWFICLGGVAHNRRFSVTVDHGSSLFRGVEEGNGVLFNSGDPLVAVSFAHIYHFDSDNAGGED